MNQYEQQSRPGKSCLPRGGDGKLKPHSAMEKASWRWKARACGPLKIASNWWGASRWSMPSCFTYFIPPAENGCKRFGVSNAIGPENDAEKRSCRFIDDAGRSVVCGTTIPQRLGASSLPIWRPFRFWHLKDAKRVSQKFGMTHMLLGLLGPDGGLVHLDRSQQLQ